MKNMAVTCRYLVILLPLIVAACGASDQRNDVGGVSPDEAQALNAAASMLDDRGRNAADAAQKPGQ